jgi:hypothetical protein
VRHPEHGVSVLASGQLTPVDRLSEGYRSLFAMSVDIMRSMLMSADNLENARGVVLIDEVETHLHPQWKMRVMSALRRAMPRVQFIATTHDPLCLRGLEDGEVVVLIRDEDSQIHQLTDLPNIKGLRAEQLLTSEYFGLDSTADPETDSGVARLTDVLQNPDSGDPGQAARLILELDKTIVVGDTPQEQIAAEALSTYLERRRHAAPAERSAARERAVEALIAAIDTSAREDTGEGGETGA